MIQNIKGLSIATTVSSKSTSLPFSSKSTSVFSNSPSYTSHNALSQSLPHTSFSIVKGLFHTTFFSKSTSSFSFQPNHKKPHTSPSSLSSHLILLLPHFLLLICHSFCTLLSSSSPTHFSLHFLELKMAHGRRQGGGRATSTSTRSKVSNSPSYTSHNVLGQSLPHTSFSTVKGPSHTTFFSKSTSSSSSQPNHKKPHTSPPSPSPSHHLILLLPHSLHSICHSFCTLLSSSPPTHFSLRFLKLKMARGRRQNDGRATSTSTQGKE